MQPILQFQIYFGKKLNLQQSHYSWNETTAESNMPSNTVYLHAMNDFQIVTLTVTSLYITASV